MYMVHTSNNKSLFNKFKFNIYFIIIIIIIINLNTEIHGFCEVMRETTLTCVIQLQ